ncbi:MAG: thiamine pyrophosphate-binding protein [Deltaproteobacteria bacterium]|nr:thiamine pyrophosphate-binding protein [Deltaproteobacteria bacterium]
MIRYECFEWMAPRIVNQIVVTSLSGQRIEWGHLSKHEGNLLLGSMGNALAVGVGLALALPHRRVIVLESDGSLLLSLFNLPTLANLGPQNLAVFVFDNQIYSGTRISEPTATAGKANLEVIAKGAGIDTAVTVRDLEEFKKTAAPALDGKGLKFVVVKVEESRGHRRIERTNVDLLENKYRFVRYLEKTEGKPIFLGHG